MLGHKRAHHLRRRAVEAAARQVGAGLLDPNQVGRLLSEVEVERPVLSAEVS